MSTNDVEPALLAMMDAVFTDYRATHPPTAVAAYDPQLWMQLHELGLTRLTGPESSGGSGAGWPEAAALLTAAVRYAVRLPLAEHDLLACWLLEANGAPCHSARRTVCVLDHTGLADRVPWAASAERIVAIWPHGNEYLIADISADSPALTITEGTNLIGEPRDTVRINTSCIHGTPLSAELLTQLELKGALARAIQVCAAIDRLVELSTAHATSRTQFGRKLAQFQAVQSLVADMAAEAALARAATDAALASAIASHWCGPATDFLVAVARSCAGHATSVAVRNAHQVHGAIGTTREHQLHEFTRAALAWRSEFGSVHYWDRRITSAALHAGPADLWKLITGSSV